MSFFINRIRKVDLNTETVCLHFKTEFDWLVSKLNKRQVGCTRQLCLRPFKLSDADYVALFSISIENI